ncbi:radical SAM protein [Petrotoga miotherma DSM 10691]|uniref:Radical SAM protein n=1 Tax=Petrotoga miotherma DSM 10691 TaxID=1434326 RepID=A0A2K1P8D8_9BACT|nr:[FeFe] hydrogenase H-cluster radical SAM maturase HydE [Petrotoga miotherma]MDN5345896.1 biotin synthase [Petrotoga sp.]PNR99065.1 radical SAM protein [Petrotoga miotherma DSM 10691]
MKLQNHEILKKLQSKVPHSPSQWADYTNFSEKVKNIVNYFISNETIEKEHIIQILSLNKHDKDREELFKVANLIRKEYTGDYINIKGVIEFSNYCKKNCYYCGLRAKNPIIQRYRMTPDEIIEVANQAAILGLDTIILQSGEDDKYTDDDLIYLIKEIRKKTSLPVSLSIGERSFSSYRKFRKAGAVRVLLKHETINKKIFKNIHPEKSYDNRIELLRYMNTLGYVTGSGNIIGLPGQTLEDIAEDILFMRNENLRMIGMGPFIPTENTPLKDHPRGSGELTLNAYCATRFCIPKAQIPTTTALGTISPDLQYQGFYAGCNVIMVNITPEVYRKNYNIYDNKIKVEFYETYEKIKQLGFSPSKITQKRMEEKKNASNIRL